MVTGRVAIFLKYFYLTEAPKPNLIRPREFAEYVRVYCRPQVLHGGFDLYRTLAADQVDNENREQRPLTIPVHMIVEPRFQALTQGHFAPQRPQPPLPPCPASITGCWKRLRARSALRSWPSITISLKGNS